MRRAGALTTLQTEGKSTRCPKAGHTAQEGRGRRGPYTGGGERVPFWNSKSKERGVKSGRVASWTFQTMGGSQRICTTFRQLLRQMVLQLRWATSIEQFPQQEHTMASSSPCKCWQTNTLQQLVHGKVLPAANGFCNSNLDTVKTSLQAQ